MTTLQCTLRGLISNLLKACCATAAAACLPSAAFAQSIFFHAEGEPGEREVYFSSTIVMDRTPPGEALGPTAIKQLDVTIISEAAAKPEWRQLRLLFECPSLIAQAQKRKKQEDTSGSSVRVRIGPGGFVMRRSDLKLVDLPAGEWFETSDRSMKVARGLACNDVEVSRAIRASYSNGRFDMDGFNQRVSKLGLTDFLAVIPVTTAVELSELTWNEMWRGSTRPDPSGKWAQQATPEDRATASANMARIQNELAELTADLGQRYEADVKRQQARFDFDDRAGRLRGDRKLNRAESSLIMVWQGRTEQEVMAALGVGHVTQTGELKVLSYGQRFDNRVVVQDLRGGGAWEEGVFMNCNVDYVLMPDGDQNMRVADIRVSVDSNNLASSASACGGLLQVPGQ